MRLVKAAEAHWRQLEAGSGDDDLMPVQTADEANKHAYPSSSRKVVDWNKLEQEGKEVRALIVCMHACMCVCVCVCVSVSVCMCVHVEACL